MEVDYSLVICTYNPEERILIRCLAAVSSLVTTGTSVEILLVDNNSSIRVENLSCVSNFIDYTPLVSVLHVSTQGVGQARMAAINAATGKHIVYFDADNEPEADYLQNLMLLNRNFPFVAAWGPGNVTVDFVDGIESVLEPYARNAFQEKHVHYVSYASMREWQSCYPFGTGLCTATHLLKEYVKEVEKGIYTMPGRVGQKLSGGEDTEMVLHVIRRGFAAGIAPELKLNHIIPAFRANYGYLQRFAYYTGLDYQTSRIQVFPEQAPGIHSLLLNERVLATKAVKRWLKLKISPDRIKMLHFLTFLGFHASIYRACNKGLPNAVSYILKNLKII